MCMELKLVIRWQLRECWFKHYQ